MNIMLVALTLCGMARIMVLAHSIKLFRKNSLNQLPGFYTLPCKLSYFVSNSFQISFGSLVNFEEDSYFLISLFDPTCIVVIRCLMFQACLSETIFYCSVR